MTDSLQLLPTPAAHDSGNTPELHLAKKPGRKVVTSLQIIANFGLISSGGELPAQPQTDYSDGVRWGPYEPAIRRWEALSNAPAPTPTLPDGKAGAHRLSAPFCEWMMGLRPGHVTDPEIGITRNAQLKALGNGVCPQQAAIAFGQMVRVAA